MDSGTETNIGILHTLKCKAIVQTCNSEVVLDPRKLSSLEGNVPLQFKNVSQALLMFCEDRTKTVIPQITLPLKYHFFFWCVYVVWWKMFCKDLHELHDLTLKGSITTLYTSPTPQKPSLVPRQTMKSHGMWINCRRELIY